MANNPADPAVSNSIKQDRRRNRLEIYNTVILGIATLGVAWCSYQSSLWNGIQTFKLADSNKFNRLAQQKTLQAGQSFQLDEAVAGDFLVGVLENKQDRVQFILKGVRPELSKIMRDWLQLYSSHDSSAPLHPLVTPAYKNMLAKINAESEKLRQDGDQSYKEGNKANTTADRYSLLTVLFSTVMFLSAIATKAIRPGVHFTLVLFSGLICVFDLIALFFYMPIARK